MPIEQDMELQRQRHMEQLQQLEEQSAQSVRFLEENGETQEFDYYQKVRHPLVDTMEDGLNVDIRQETGHAEVRETRYERKKRTQREQKMTQAREKALNVKQAEADMLDQRQAQITAEGATTEQSVSREQSLLSLKLEAIKLNKEAAFDDLKAERKLTDAVQREIEWKAQADVAAAVGDFARMLPPGTAERARAMARKEKEELKADELKRWYKVTQIEAPAEREREEATIKRHAKYDVMKSITSFFSSDNPLTHEDAFWEQDGKKLVNVGRAFFGGTKPMYIFEDRNAPIMNGGQTAGYKKYLFKTAVNCLGFKKPEGALVTEAAAQLQRTICGNLSIPAFAAIQGGEVLGSFQEKIERTGEPEQPVDLFQWQANPSTDLPADTKDELLREHMLDWLLCNFDTKGENFLQTQDGHIMSFDKEASFSFITKEGSQHMDTEYVPHSNTTIYNVLFTQFANGSLDLNLQRTEDYLARIEDMDREQYMGMFETMLTQRYGEAGERNAERRRIEELIWSRKDDLREEYRRFYGDLLERRRNALRERDIPFDHTDEVAEDGHRFKFAGDGQRVQTLCRNEQLRGLVPNVTQQQLRDHGCASFHQLRSREEAELLVRDSRGFLYMKEAGHGTYEIRPTMPETAQIDGREINFRRNYNRFIKMIVRMGMDERGNLRPNAKNVLEKIISFLGPSLNEKSKARAEEEIGNGIMDMLGELSRDKSIFGEDLQQGIEEFADFLKSMIKMRRSTDRKHPDRMEFAGSVLINMEMDTAWEGWVNSVNATSEPLEQRIEKVRRKMLEGGASEDEISAKTEAVTMLYKDAQTAMEKMAELRDMDVDSPDVALVNACSSNADMLAQLVAKARSEAPQTVQFFTWTHVVQNPREIIDWLTDKQKKSHGEFLGRRQNDEFEALKTVLADAVTCTKQQAERLLSLADNGAKYDYHKAPVIATSGEKAVTCETFAPETCQLTVSPFTRNIAVGVYNHGVEDMLEYYKLDNPLADDKMLARARVKVELLSGTLPGDSGT